MRCPRCGSANSEDFFQNTQRQTRSFGAVSIDGDGGGMGSYGEDLMFWTCKNCMVRLVSDAAYTNQQEAVRRLNMTPEERKEEDLKKYGPPKDLGPLGCLWALFLIGLIGVLIYGLYVFITLPS